MRLLTTSGDSRHLRAMTKCKGCLREKRYSSTISGDDRRTSTFQPFVGVIEDPTIRRYGSLKSSKYMTSPQKAT
ncbi:hypothetical protein DPMN_125622 [Dreissena polymorpha]|uniref:Uncharacterized protein n=1 Tax=Dreissena polymorpha TaxID=45954 RepID=A0A9D4GY50_DREPO|nr:hypothetical protein DPMN_125622 [Dreissena polymorpha]